MTSIQQMNKLFNNNLFYFLTIIVLSLFFIGCPEPNPPTENEVRFKPLSDPIEGKLLFVAGPTLEELDTLQRNDPWDFYQLSGKEFLKINENPWYIYQGSPWHYKWSPNGRYFSFYHDKDGIPINTDDIGVIDINSMQEIYLTDSIGDANTFDEAIYHWALDDSYIYFTAIHYGEYEYDPSISPDIYRAKPDGSAIEQITDNDYYEAHAIPSLDGTKIFYGIYSLYGPLDAPFGYYLYDLNSNTTKRIVTKEQYEEKYGQPGHPPAFWHKETIYWHPNGKFVIINISTNEKLVKIDVDSGNMEIIECTGIGSILDLLLIPNNDKLAILYEGWGDGDNIYTVDLTTGITQNLTNQLTTLDGQNCRFGMPTLSPNSEYIAFTAQLNYDSSDWLEGTYDLEEFIVEQKTEIYMMNLQTKEVTRLTDGLFGWEGYLKWIQ